MITSRIYNKKQCLLINKFLKKISSGVYFELTLTDQKINLIDFICNSSCQFFKPKEEMECFAFTFISNKIKELQSSSVFDNDSLANNPTIDLTIPSSDLHFEEKLLKNVCKKCEFFSDGCDYRDDTIIYPNKGKKYPCGGVILLRNFPALL